MTRPILVCRVLPAKNQTLGPKTANHYPDPGTTRPWHATIRDRSNSHPEPLIIAVIANHFTNGQGDCGGIAVLDLSPFHCLLVSVSICIDEQSSSFQVATVPAHAPQRLAYCSNDRASSNKSKDDSPSSSVTCHNTLKLLCSRLILMRINPHLILILWRLSILSYGVNTCPLDRDLKIEHVP